MSDENFNNTDGQNSAPQVSKISLDELNEIKKTIAPIHSENELEVLRNNPDIDSNTVYSEHKPAQTNSEDIDISDLKVETPRIEKNEDGDVVAINEEKPTTSIAPQILETEETSKIDVSEQISENHEEVTQNAQKSEPQVNVEEKVSNINKSDNLSLFESIIQELNNIKVIPKTQKPDVNYSRTQGAENITSEHEQLTTSVSQVSENIDSDIPQVEENERPVETEENAQSDAQEIVDEINDLQAEMIDETAKLEEQVNNEQSSQHEEYNDEMEHGLYGKSDDEIVDTSKIESDNTEAIKAEEEAPKTAKVDLSEIKALQAEMKKEKEEGKSERKSIKEIMDEINHKGQNEEEVVEPGEYDKSLDFEKVTDIKKFKLPVRKLPIILSLVFILLAGVGFLLVNNFLQNKANQV